MEGVRDDSKIPEWPSSALAFPAIALVAGLCVLPTLLVGFRDLFPSFDSIKLVMLAVAVCAALLGVLASIGTRAGAQANRARSKWRTFMRDAGVASLVVSLGVGFVAWESDNLFSWRMAKQLTPAEGVSARKLVLRGTHISQLELTAGGDRQSYVARVPLPYNLSLTGGTISLAARSSGTSVQRSEYECGVARKSLRGTEIIDLRLARIVLPVGCADWISGNWEFDAGVRTLLVELEGTAGRRAQIEVVFTAINVNYGYALTILNIIAFSALIAIALAAFPRSGRPEADKPPEVPVSRSWRPRDTRWTVASIGVFLVVANTAVYSFVSGERTIYTWDFAGHWMSAISASVALGGDVSAARTGLLVASEAEEQDRGQILRRPEFYDAGMLRTLIRNVRYAEYNVTPAILPAFPMAIVGPSRLVYELALVNVYALAALCMTILLLWEFLRRDTGELLAAWPLVPTLSLLCFSPFWVPLVRGYLGVCVVAIDLLVLWLYLRRPIRRQSLMLLFAIGALLTISVALRRWNAVWVVTFFAMAVLDAARDVYRSREYSIETFLAGFRPLLIAGTSAALILATLAWPLLITISSTDYSDIYSAYAGERSHQFDQIGHFVRTFGIGLIGFVALAGIYLAATEKLRWITILLVFQIIAGAWYFTSLQEMGPHHMYILIPAALTLLNLGAVYAWKYSCSHKYGRAAVLAVLSLFFLNGVASNVAVFVPLGKPVRDVLAPIVPDNRRLPLVRNDISELARLAQYLDTEINQSDVGTGIYVLSSSDVFNVSHLGMLEVSTGYSFRARNYLLRTAAVDKRDGFPRRLLDAELVAVGWPPQFNVPPDDQHVIAIPSTMMANNIAIGQAFERLPQTFELDDNVHVHIYRRTRAVRDEEAAELSRRLRTIYPDRPAIYEP